MERIERVVRTARRRLALGLFAARGARAALALAAVFLLVVISARLFSLGLPLRELAIGLLPAAVLAGLVAALFARPTRLGAAVELDRRLSLGERISSAILVGETPDRPIEQAVVADAATRLERVDLRRAFPIRPPRDLARAAAILAVAGLVAAFVPELGLLSESKGAQDPAKKSEEQRAKDDAKKIDNVRKRIEDQAKGKDLPAVNQAMQEIDELSKRLQAAPPNRKQELAKLSSLEDKLKERLKSLPSLDKLGQQMKDMPQQERTRDLQGALAQQELDKAKIEAKKLAEQVMEAAKAGDTKKLEEMAKQLDKLAQAADSVPGLKQALEKLAKAAAEQAKNQAEGGEKPEDADKLAEAMKSAEKDLDKALEDAQKAEEEAELLAKAAEGIGKAKEGLQSLGDDPKECPDCQGVCPQCKQASCGACGTPECVFAGQDPDDPAEPFDCQCPESQCSGKGGKGGCGKHLGKKGHGSKKTGDYAKGDPTGKKGQGMGGPGQGDGGERPYGDDNQKMDTKREKVNPRRSGSKTVGSFFVDGVKLDDKKQHELTEAAAAEGAREAEALDKARIPPAEKKFVKEYFDSLTPAKEPEKK